MCLCTRLYLSQRKQLTDWIYLVLAAASSLKFVCQFSIVGSFVCFTFSNADCVSSHMLVTKTSLLLVFLRQTIRIKIQVQSALLSMGVATLHTQKQTIALLYSLVFYRAESK